MIKNTKPILDDDIITAKCSIESNALEEDSYRFYLSSLLLAMSYAFIELRHYSSAIESLTECISLSDNLLSEAYFRRSQARLYNKKSKTEDLFFALADIKKAISINKDSKIYLFQHKAITKKIEDVKAEENNKINSMSILVLFY